MAAILLDKITIDLTDSSDYTNWQHDAAVLSNYQGGDEHELRIQVGADDVTLRAPLTVMMMIMDAIAADINYKTLPVITEQYPHEADCFDEYFDIDGNYVKKPCSVKIDMERMQKAIDSERIEMPSHINSANEIKKFILSCVDK